MHNMKSILFGYVPMVGVHAEFTHSVLALMPLSVIQQQEDSNIIKYRISNLQCTFGNTGSFHSTSSGLFAGKRVTSLLIKREYKFIYKISTYNRTSLQEQLFTWNAVKKHILLLPYSTKEQCHLLKCVHYPFCNKMYMQLQ